MQFIEARARYFGFLAGVKFGEPLLTEEKVKLKPLDLFNI
jgi:hypothetical protein